MLQRVLSPHPPLALAMVAAAVEAAPAPVIRRAAAPPAELPACALLDQSFTQLEEAFQNGVWEVDGDDLSVYVCQALEGDGPDGAMLVASGNSSAQAELVHSLCDGEGARVSRLALQFVCEELSTESDGNFTVGLAFDEDLEEASLLALSVRRTLVFTEGEEEPQPKAVELHLNGHVIQADMGALPVHVELDTELRWDSLERSVQLRYRLRPEGGDLILPHPAQADHGAAADNAWGQFSEVSTGFYTTTVQYENAKALYLRCRGGVKVRLLSLHCSAEA